MLLMRQTVTAAKEPTVPKQFEGEGAAIFAHD
jgi:hypothetical protein